MAEYIKLNEPPIREIILSISFKENILIEKLEAYKNQPSIKSKFPLSNKGFSAEVDATNEKAPTTNISPDGFILKSGNPHINLLQIRRGTIAFHRVSGYECYENLVSEFKEFWTLFLSICGNLTVNTLTVRYLNFIELTENEKYNDLITIQTTHPFGNEAKIFTQSKFRYKNSDNLNVTVVSTVGKIENKNGIILDITLNKKINNEENKTFDFDEFNELQAIKNELFFNSITEKTIQKYST